MVKVAGGDGGGAGNRRVLGWQAASGARLHVDHSVQFHRALKAYKLQ